MPKQRKRPRHSGRVTESKADLADERPTQSPRYTPPTPNYRVRPRWHRIAGWFGVLAGVAIAIANDAMLFSDDLTLLPGRHQELYLILGVAVAGGSTWFLGLFDRGTTIYD